MYTDSKQKIQKSQLFPFKKQHTLRTCICSEVGLEKTKQTFLYQHIVILIAFQTQEFVNLINQTYMQLKQLNSFSICISKPEDYICMYIYTINYK